LGFIPHLSDENGDKFMGSLPLIVHIGLGPIFKIERRKRNHKSRGMQSAGCQGLGFHRMGGGLLHGAPLSRELKCLIAMGASSLIKGKAHGQLFNIILQLLLAMVVWAILFGTKVSHGSIGRWWKLQWASLTFV